MHGNYVLGADFSFLEEAEALGMKFRDRSGEYDAVGLLASHGINCARIRLCVDPSDSKHRPYGFGACDIQCAKRIALRAKDYGMSIMLSLTYSDYLTDGGCQLMPKKWKELEYGELCRTVRKYTFGVLAEMKNSGLAPTFTEIGCGIENGILWDAGKIIHSGERDGDYTAFFGILANAFRGAREASDTKLIISPGSCFDTPSWERILDGLTVCAPDFDIIGTSYFPLIHGDCDLLGKRLASTVARYKRDILVTGTGYPYTAKQFSHGAPDAALTISDFIETNDGGVKKYPASRHGQADFIKALLSRIRCVPCDHGVGVIYSEPIHLTFQDERNITVGLEDYAGVNIPERMQTDPKMSLFDYNGTALPALSEFLEASRTF